MLPPFPLSARVYPCRRRRALLRAPRAARHADVSSVERFDQYGTRVQWAEPVTGSSGMPARGAKKRETKSDCSAFRRDDQAQVIEGGDARRGRAPLFGTCSSSSQTTKRSLDPRTWVRPEAEHIVQVRHRLNGLRGTCGKVHHQQVPLSLDRQRAAFRLKADP